MSEAALFFEEDPSFFAEVAKSVGHDFEENLASRRHQREAPVVATLLRYFPRHPYNHDDVVECKQDFVGTVIKPKLEQFRRQLIRSHSLAIGHRSQGLFLSHSQPAGLRVTGLSVFAIGPL